MLPRRAGFSRSGLVLGSCYEAHRRGILLRFSVSFVVFSDRGHLVDVAGAGSAADRLLERARLGPAVPRDGDVRPGGAVTDAVQVSELVVRQRVERDLLEAVVGHYDRVGHLTGDQPGGVERAGRGLTGLDL